MFEFPKQTSGNGYFYFARKYDSRRHDSRPDDSTPRHANCNVRVTDINTCNFVCSFLFRIYISGLCHVWFCFNYLLSISLFSSCISDFKSFYTDCCILRLFSRYSYIGQLNIMLRNYSPTGTLLCQNYHV